MGAELAREAKAFPAYHAAVFRGAFDEGLDISSREVLADIAHRAGMDRERFLADLQSERMAPRISENKREADGQSALGYPTFILGEFPLIGIQPIDTMRLALNFLTLHAPARRKPRQLTSNRAAAARILFRFFQVCRNP